MWNSALLGGGGEHSIFSQAAVGGKYIPLISRPPIAAHMALLLLTVPSAVCRAAHRWNTVPPFADLLPA